MKKEVKFCTPSMKVKAMRIKANCDFDPLYILNITKAEEDIIIIPDASQV
jgi:hypothetical protein